MALMLVRAYIIGVDRYVVGDRRKGNDSFLQPPILGGMTGIEGAYAGLEFLAVAAGMHDIADIVMAEDGELRDCVADPIVRPRRVSGRRKLSDMETRLW